jgi:hypothetical protein
MFRHSVNVGRKPDMFWRTKIAHSPPATDDNYFFRSLTHLRFHPQCSLSADGRAEALF